MNTILAAARAGCASFLGGGIFLLVGLGLLGFGGFVGFNTYRQLSTWPHAAGRVVDLAYDEDGDGGTIVMPVVRYTTGEGEIVTARPYQERNTSVDASYDLGDGVEVVYNPDRPEDMFINDFMHVWFVPSLTGGLGALFTLIGAGWGLAAAVGALRRAGQGTVPLQPPTFEI